MKWKKKRRIEYLERIEKRFCIFCEGVQTEPLYFQGFKTYIESNPAYKNLVMVEVIGVGADTIRVLEYAQSYIARYNITNADIWCVYDKDSFPAENFDLVSKTATELNKAQNRVKYNVAWSNQCIEYWFILHFAFYDVQNNRDMYIKFLNKKFIELGVGKYEKNDSSIFNILYNFGNPKLAVRYAQMRLSDCCGKSDTDSFPATKVHLLVTELIKYLPANIINKFRC